MKYDYVMTVLCKCKLFIFLMETNQQSRPLDYEHIKNIMFKQPLKMGLGTRIVAILMIWSQEITEIIIHFSYGISFGKRKNPRILFNSVNDFFLLRLATRVEEYMRVRRRCLHSVEQ